MSFLQSFGVEAGFVGWLQFSIQDGLVWVESLRERLRIRWAVVEVAGAKSSVAERAMDWVSGRTAF